MTRKDYTILKYIIEMNLKEFTVTTPNGDETTEKSLDAAGIQQVLDTVEKLLVDRQIIASIHN